MKYTIHYSGRFKKSYKLCKRRGLNIANFETVVGLLAETGMLPDKYRPHILSGFKLVIGYRKGTFFQSTPPTFRVCK